MQIQRMKKTNKKVKMAVGGMTPTPKKMSLRETLAASNARRQSFAAQANSTAMRNPTPGDLAKNRALEQQSINQRNLALAQSKNTAKTPVAASVTQANNATKLANMFKKSTPAPSPAAAPRSNRFSRQAANAAPKPMMAKGGMVKSNCGASMKPTQKGKK